MKQHITIEQLKELDQKQIKKLNELYINPYLCIIANPELEFLKAIEQDYIEAARSINIGNMIEILCKSDFCFPSIGLTESRKRSEYIVVGVTCLSGTEELRGKTFEAEELCNALWQAVKEVLR